MFAPDNLLALSNDDKHPSLKAVEKKFDGERAE